MTILPESLDYSSKDFDALKARLVSLIRSLAPVFPWWTDFNKANFGNILVELFCHVGDVLTFYQDAQARESRILSATQRKSLLALCKLLAYQPPSASPATVDVTFSIPSPVAGDIALPAGTVVRTTDVRSPVKFQLLVAQTIPAGATSVSVTVENSASWIEIVPSTARPNQEYQLTRTPYIDGTTEATAGDGSYSEVLNFLDSGASDRHFTVSVDQNGRAIVRFGNGVNGKIPTGTITFVYKTGGGLAGNVAANAILKIDGSFMDAFGTPVSISVANPLAASGGANRATMAQIKLMAPSSVRVAGRTVAREDYEINARRVPGIARAFMATSNEIPMTENTGQLYVVPAGGGVPSTAKKQEVLDMVTMSQEDFVAAYGYDGGYPHTLTFHVDVLDPVYLTVDVQTTVYLRKGYGAAAAKAAIEAALDAFFAITLDDGSPNPNVDFGWNVKDADGNPALEIAWSDVFNVVRDIPAVRKVDESATGLLLNGDRSDVPVGANRFPILGSVTVYDGDTGGLL